MPTHTGAEWRKGVLLRWHRCIAHRVNDFFSLPAPCPSWFRQTHSLPEVGGRPSAGENTIDGVFEALAVRLEQTALAHLGDGRRLRSGRRSANASPRVTCTSTRVTAQASTGTEITSAVTRFPRPTRIVMFHVPRRGCRFKTE